jgi:hypothetical protein
MDGTIPYQVCPECREPKDNHNDMPCAACVWKAVQHLLKCQAVEEARSSRAYRERRLALDAVKLAYENSGNPDLLTAISLIAWGSSEYPK